MSKELKYLIALLVMVSHGCTNKTLNNNKPMQPNYNPSAIKLPIEGVLPSLDNATEWLNTKPLKTAGLRGKVVLINFCTYSCINWLRTLPYMRSWAEKYKDKGLLVVAVHTPEFLFEKNIDNVRRAITTMKIGYPVAIDNDYSIWKAFDNQYWPALYFIDVQGKIRHHQFGEGEYEQSEKVIRQLLTEAGVKDVGKEQVTVQAEGIEVAADWNNLQSNENYMGYARTQNFSSPGSPQVDKNMVYLAPSKFSLNQWALAGEWTMKKNAIVSNKTNGRIVYRFHARDLHIVMGPLTPGTFVRFRVLIDGQPPATAQGTDIDEHGYGIVSEQKLYQLIRQTSNIIDRQFEIEFFDAGVEVFSFTFG